MLLYSGRRQLAATATRLPLAEATAALQDYAAHHPKAFHNLAKMMVGQGLEGSEADCQLLAQSVPLVTLTPRP